MQVLPATDRTRQRRLIVAVAVVILLLLAGAAYAALGYRSQSSHAAPIDIGQGSVESSTIVTDRVGTVPRPLRSTSDPDLFARQVAEAILAWDTTTLVTRAERIEGLVHVADPTGVSTPGMILDLEGYLPTPDAWAELAKYQTRQWLVVDSVTMPHTWGDAQDQAGGSLLPGTTARTVLGARHRYGIWAGKPVHSEHSVAFTVFVVCGPSYPQCHLLRLSMLDKPLE